MTYRPPAKTPEEREAKHLVAKRNESANYRATTNFNPTHDPHEWTTEDLIMVMAHEMSDRKIAQCLQTSVKAVQHARYRVRRGIYPESHIILQITGDPLAHLSKYSTSNTRQS